MLFRDSIRLGVVMNETVFFVSLIAILSVLFVAIGVAIAMTVAKRKCEAFEFKSQRLESALNAANNRLDYLNKRLSEEIESYGNLLKGYEQLRRELSEREREREEVLSTISYQFGIIQKQKFAIDKAVKSLVADETSTDDCGPRDKPNKTFEKFFDEVRSAGGNAWDSINLKTELATDDCGCPSTGLGVCSSCDHSPLSNSKTAIQADEVSK
jgi:hypothetical protein